MNTMHWSIGERIKHERITRKIKFSQMVKLTGISQSTLQRIEKKCNYNIQCDHIVKIAAALNVSCDYLLRGDIIEDDKNFADNIDKKSLQSKYDALPKIYQSITLNYTISMFNFCVDDYPSLFSILLSSIPTDRYDEIDQFIESLSLNFPLDQ